METKSKNTNIFPYKQTKSKRRRRTGFKGIVNQERPVDDNNNSLVAFIMKYITLRGGFVNRLSSTSIYDKQLKLFTTLSARKGFADIVATYKSLSLSIDVKTGRDRQSEYQKRIEAEVTAFGGYYFLAKNFESFKKWFDSINN